MRAKNSHNLAHTKIQDSPPPQPAAKKRHGRGVEALLTPWRRRVPVLQGGSSGRRNGGGIAETRLSLQHAAGPATSLHTYTAGGCGWRRQCTAAAQSPFYLYSTPRVLSNFAAYLYSREVRVERGDGGRQGEPPSTSTAKPTTVGAIARGSWAPSTSCASCVSLAAAPWRGRRAGVRWWGRGGGCNSH